MTSSIATEIKIPPLEWPVAVTKVRRFRNKLATYMPSEEVSRLHWKDSPLQPSIVNVAGLFAIKVEAQPDGEELLASQNGWHLLTFNRDLSKEAGLKEGITELAHYLIEGGVILLPRQRHWKYSI